MPGCHTAVGADGSREGEATKQITLDCNTDATVVICVTATKGVMLSFGILGAVMKCTVYDLTWKTTVQSHPVTN